MRMNSNDWHKNGTECKNLDIQIMMGFEGGIIDILFFADLLRHYLEGSIKFKIKCCS
jgi:hypothetical protein